MLDASYTGKLLPTLENSLVRIAAFTPSLSTSVVEVQSNKGRLGEAYEQIQKAKQEACAQVGGNSDAAPGTNGSVTASKLAKEGLQLNHSGARAGSFLRRLPSFNPIIEGKFRAGGSPSLDEIMCGIVARLAQVHFVGLMHGACNKQLVLFVVPATQNTLALPLNDFHVGRIHSHVKASNERFGVEND